MLNIIFNIADANLADVNLIKVDIFNNTNKIINRFEDFIDFVNFSKVLGFSNTFNPNSGSSFGFDFKLAIFNIFDNLH